MFLHVTIVKQRACRNNVCGVYNLHIRRTKFIMEHDEVFTHSDSRLRFQPDTHLSGCQTGIGVGRAFLGL